MTENAQFDQAFEEIQQLLQKHGGKFDYQITFPKYRQLPEEVLLALKVLKNHGMTVVFSVVPDENVA